MPDPQPTNPAAHAATPTVPEEKPEVSQNAAAPTVPEEKPKVSQNAAAPTVPESPPGTARYELTRYIEAFGAENGVAWYLEQRDFAACQAEHLEKLAARTGDQDKQIAELTAERNQLRDQVAELKDEHVAVSAQLTAKTAECSRLRQAIIAGEADPAEFGAFLEPLPHAAELGESRARRAAAVAESRNRFRQNGN